MQRERWESERVMEEERRKRRAAGRRRRPEQPAHRGARSRSRSSQEARSSRQPSSSAHAGTSTPSSSSAHQYGHADNSGLYYSGHYDAVLLNVASSEEAAADVRSCRLLEEIERDRSLDGAQRVIRFAGRDGRTALHWAARNGHAKLCKMILGIRWMNVHVLRLTKDGVGWLPLHWAIM